MNISIEVGHPAHVHYWRPVREALLRDGHHVVVFARPKENTLTLLEHLGIRYEPVGWNFPSIVGKAAGLFYNDWEVLRQARRLHVDLMLSGGMPYSAHASALLDVPHLAIVDTEHAKLTLAITLPYTDVVCTPSCFRTNLAHTRQVRFDGYVESMYLRPDYFTPNPAVLDRLRLKQGELYSVVRFSSWDSSHDFGHTANGLETAEGKLELVQTLERFGRVLVTSEVPLPPSLRSYRSTLPPEDVHSLLSYASMYVGEGAKMAAEAGMLGTPWIFLSPSHRCYLDEQEHRFGLGRTVGRLGQAVDQSIAWLSDSGTKPNWSIKRTRMLASTVDVTEFILGEIRSLIESRGLKESLVGEGS